MAPDDRPRVRPGDAPKPPSGRRWRLELVVASLGVLTGLASAMAFFG